MLLAYQIACQKAKIDWFKRKDYTNFLLCGDDVCRFKKLHFQNHLKEKEIVLCQPFK